MGKGNYFARFTYANLLPELGYELVELVLWNGSWADPAKSKALVLDGKEDMDKNISRPTRTERV